MNPSEISLTDIEHRMMLALGLAVIPEEDNQGGNLEAVIYSMAAAMVGADGKIEQEEMEAAEEPSRDDPRHCGQSAHAQAGMKKGRHKARNEVFMQNKRIEAKPRHGNPTSSSP